MLVFSGAKIKNADKIYHEAKYSKIYNNMIVPVFFRTEYYDKPCVELAKDLLGKVLCRDIGGDQILKGRPNLQFRYLISTCITNACHRTFDCIFLQLA